PNNSSHPPGMFMSGDVSGVDLSPDGHRVLGYGGGEVRVWDVAGQRGMRSLLDESGFIPTRAEMGEGGSRGLTTAHSLGATHCRLWDVATGGPLTPRVRFADVDEVLMNSSSSRLLTVHRDGRAGRAAPDARLWSLQPNRAPARLAVIPGARDGQFS